MVISVSFTAVALLGVLFMWFTFLWRFDESERRTSAENAERILAQVNMNLDSYLRTMMRVSDAVCYRVIKDSDLESDSLLEGMTLLYEENLDSLVSIAVFTSDGELEAAVPLSTLKSSAEPSEAGWFTAANERMENLHFSTPHIQELFDDPDYRYRWVVSLSRYVRLTRGADTEGGVLLVDMNFGGIARVCRDVELQDNGYVYLIDRSGELIYHPKQQLIYTGLMNENNLAAARYSDGTHVEEFEGERRYVTVKTVGYTGWRIVGVIPENGTAGLSGPTVLFGLSVLLFSAFLMTFLNFRISAYISDPIRRLDAAVKQFEAGSEEVEISEAGFYEIRHLARSIRSMVSTMRHLTEDIIVQEEQKRRSELEVLQSQINPHFLYNTLDSVIWMTESGRYQEAIQTVSSLARLFRISLSKGKRIIPLKDELEHARNYLNIQQIRYKNRFNVSINAGEGTEELYTLKLTIQPLLENAITHGFEGTLEGGEITIDARREGDDLIISVTDDGVGIRPDVARTLLDENRPEIHTKGSGIGVRNVHRRLRLTFGEEYGLTIFSEPDEGTTVRMRLPALDKAASERYGGEDVV